MTRWQPDLLTASAGQRRFLCTNRTGFGRNGILVEATPRFGRSKSLGTGTPSTSSARLEFADNCVLHHAALIMRIHREYLQRYRCIRGTGL